MLHLYCVAPASCAPPPGLAGVEDAPVSSVHAAELAVWTSQHDAAPAASIDAARAHHRVVAAAMNEQVTPVPLRFGQLFSDADDAADRIAERAAGWSALLRRFAGRAEYSVRLFDAASDAAREMHPAAAPTGTGYMTALAQRERMLREQTARMDAAADVVARAVAQLAIETKKVPQPDGSLDITQLVAWEDAAAYHTAVAGLQSELGGIEASVTGPWPPWTFAA